MKPHSRKIYLPVRIPVLSLCWIMLFSLCWMGYRFIQAAQRFGYLYEVNSRLWQAAGEGRTALVEHLLAEGADVNYSDAGMTVLQVAVESGNPKTVAALLRHGADVNGYQYSPLRMAKEAHNQAIVALLKKAGAKE